PAELTARKNTAKVEQRIRKMTNPNRGKVTDTLKNLGKSLLAAAVLALFITILLPPAEIPSPLGPMELTPSPTIYDDLTNASSHPFSRRCAYSEVGANAYLQSAYRSRDFDFYMIPLRYERTFAKFNEGSVDVTAHITFLGLPIYAGGTYTVNLKSGKLD